MFQKKTNKQTYVWTLSRPCFCLNSDLRPDVRNEIPDAAAAGERATGHAMLPFRGRWRLPHSLGETNT